MSRWLVVPCFNEAKRLDQSRILSYTSTLQCNVLLVNDASTDTTQNLIDVIVRSSNGTVHSLVQTRNSGKAEAVRAGLLSAINYGASIVGYTDADGAVSEFDLVRLFDELDLDGANNAVIGSRVALLGHQITRNPVRHVTGRIFATLASLTLHQTIYDTQCGAKIFRVNSKFQTSLSDPFISKWGFDVELLGRLFKMAGTHSAHGIREVPLTSWDDIEGSKLKTIHGIKTFWELFAIRKSLSKWTT